MTQTLQIKLILLSGDIQKIKHHIHKLVRVDEIDTMSVLKIDEKSLAKFRNILKLVRQDRHSAFIFGCKNLGIQRYQFALNFFLLFARAKEKFIIDEMGNVNYFSYWSYFVVEVSKFCLEVLLSALVITLSYVRLVFLKHKLSRRTLSR